MRAFAGIERSVDGPTLAILLREHRHRAAVRRQQRQFQLPIPIVQGLINQREAKCMLSANTGNNLANCIFGQNPIVPACYYDCGRGHGLRPVERWSAPGAVDPAPGALSQDYYAQYGAPHENKRPGRDRIPQDAQRAQCHTTSRWSVVRRQFAKHPALGARRPPCPTRRRHCDPPPKRRSDHCRSSRGGRRRPCSSRPDKRRRQKGTTRSP